MTDYYVDNATGSDADTGLSEALAWETIQHAANTAVAGDTVYIKGGTPYTERVDFNTNDGTVTSVIRFIGYTSIITDNGKFTITGSGSTDYCIRITSTDHIQISNCIFTDATAGCVQTLGNSLQWRFVRCEFLRGSSTATYAFRHNGYTTLTQSIICDSIFDGFTTSVNGSCLHQCNLSFCTIRNMGGAGFIVEAYRANRFYYCLIHSNVGDGITVSNAATCDIINCTIANNDGDGIDWAAITTNTGSTVINNIIANHAGAGDFGFRRANPGSASTWVLVQRNAYYNNTTHRSAAANALDGSNVTLSVDPFVDAANDDYRLNNTAGGGAVLRATEFAFDAGANIHYGGFGVLDPETEVASGGGVFNKGILIGGNL
jgi:hypothetical protein